MRRINLTLNTRIIRKALSLDLSYFENAEYYDKLENARREADWRSLQIVNGGFYLVQNALTLLSYAALLLGFSPLLALILFAATIPAFIAQSRYAELTFRVLSWRAPESRKLSVLRAPADRLPRRQGDQALRPGRAAAGALCRLVLEVPPRGSGHRAETERGVAGLGLLVASMTYYLSYAWIVWRTVAGTISLGDDDDVPVHLSQQPGAVQRHLPRLERPVRELPCS